MSGLPLLRVFDSVYLVALASWVGSILFFSFGVAPVIFKVLKPEVAGAFVRALFPRYYAWGAISGAVALPCLVCGALAVPELRGPSVGVQSGLLMAGILVMLYCGNVLTPAINAARDAGPEQAQRFDRLNGRSVSLNSLVVVLGMGLIVAHVYRPAPQSEGIYQPSPAEMNEMYRRRQLESMRRNQAFWNAYGQQTRGAAPAKAQTAATASAPAPAPAKTASAPAP